MRYPQKTSLIFSASIWMYFWYKCYKISNRQTSHGMSFACSLIGTSVDIVWDLKHAIQYLTKLLYFADPLTAIDNNLKTFWQMNTYLFHWLECHNTILIYSFKHGQIKLVNNNTPNTFTSNVFFLRWDFNHVLKDYFSFSLSFYLTVSKHEIKVCKKN